MVVYNFAFNQLHLAYYLAYYLTIYFIRIQLKNPTDARYNPNKCTSGSILSYAVFFFFSLLTKRNAHKPAKAIVMTTSTGITGIGETLAQTSFSP